MRTNTNCGFPDVPATCRGDTPSMTTALLTDEARELAQRAADGIVVTLHWLETSDEIVVSYTDERTGEGFSTPVPRAEALEAFKHPNVYR